MKTFKQLGLSNEFIENLKSLKILEPTEIQEKSIPFILKGKDIVASAATGSGKTLSFISGIIQNMIPIGKSRVLILTPTRELAEQIASEFRKFAVKKFRVFSLYGGVNIQEHVKKVKGADIIVATPGRLLDVINRQALNLKDIEVLIIDEFDRMLDMGFNRDVELIIRKCPKDRQTMLFSATKFGEIEELIKEYTNNPKEIIVKSHIDATKLKQVYYNVKQKEKFSLFYSLIKNERQGKSLVFCSTRINTEFIGKSLEKLGLDIKIIHGGLNQKQRTRVLKSFHQGGGILVCTDIAARGLDIKQISNVYNYDLPKKEEDYIHRIGRTARAGKEGEAITILSPRDKEMFEKILELPNIKIQEMDLPIFDKIHDEFLPKLKKQTNEKTHTKKRGIQWESINDSDLSSRFKKKTMKKSFKDDENSNKSKKKTRRAGKKRKNERSSSKNKKISQHKPRKGKKVKRGRAGNPKGKRKINKRPKGQANRKGKS